MADIEVEDTMVVSDISEAGYSSGEGGGDDGGLLPEQNRGVRNVGLAPFVTKLYNIVSDKNTDSIISWVPNLNLARMEKQTNFVIWNVEEFINNILPLMSKSKNFDSFITQLNNYGFKKTSWDRREYENEWFQEGKPHVLKNIKRKNKRKISKMEKLECEIRKFVGESKELDHELKAFKEYVEKTVSKQKRIVEVMAKAIKSTINHHHYMRKAHGVENSYRATQSLILVGQQGQQTNILGELSFASNCEVQAEDEVANMATNASEICLISRR